jgi:hypothetical protein
LPIATCPRSGPTRRWITIDDLEQRFGVERMLHAPQTHGFLASLLYFFGVLTYSGRDPLGNLQLSNESRIS